MLKAFKFYVRSVMTIKPIKNELPETNDAAYEAKASKVDVTLLPVEAVFEGSRAMADGARKYGRGQWATDDRVTRVKILAAMLRHTLLLIKGEMFASDSKVHHAGHVIANAGILLARFDKDELPKC